ncbi:MULTISPECIES: hypothetical protein [Bacillaceae]|uniref:hypothetical protein n=1 Tax=Bacillaceae TaxID=186817 RepID=UPI000A2AD2F6|nr:MULTISPECIES: hypothetical protein [unclassified Bacillus (in: firmicutes)]PGY14273.1 hypothetical protein COE25_06575 [Bacillus sp. AFS031507]SMQ81881.1 hypothetical protein SAMN05444673_4565 [Bacillus sp. OV166]
MNRVGKYAANDTVDDLELMNMVFELPEKDKMIMWSEGYIDLVIEKLPEYARDVLENRKEKWEDTKAYYQMKIEDIINQEEFKLKQMGERKEFALFVMKRYPEYQSLLFLIYDGNLKEDDFRKFVYRKRLGSRKKYLH